MISKGRENVARCEDHQEHAVILDRLETGAKNMEQRISKIEEKVYSPAVMVAVLGLVGTMAATAGGVLSTVLIIIAKTHGWG